ncbi:MAG: extracellular solute-binding protein [Candidatus Melainabacteria bacterium]|nr:extracellular solute-binding protein [Candidatus Melainabacteria bacterium]
MPITQSRQKWLLSFILTLSFIAGICLLLAGCTAEKSTPKPKTTLTLWTLQLQEFSAVIQPALAEFEANHPNVKVNWVDIPFSEGEKRVLTAMLSPTVPDVINLNPSFSMLLAKKKALHNLADTALVSKAEAAEYLPVAWQGCQLAGGQFQYAIPWYITTKLRIVNTPLLQQGGKQFEHLPMAESLPQEALTAFKQKTNGAFYVLPDLGSLLKYLFQQNINAFTLDSTTYQPHFMLAQNPTTIKTLEFWQQAYANKNYSSDVLVNGYSAAVQAYQTGKLAVLEGGASLLKSIETNSPAIYANTKVYPLQNKDQTQRRTDILAMVLVVPAKSEHPKLAAELALWLTNTKNQLALAKAAPVLPSTVAGLKDGWFQPSATLEVKSAVEEARVLGAKQLLEATEPFPVLPNQKLVNEAVKDTVQTVLFKQQPIQPALEALDAKLNEK